MSRFHAVTMIAAFIYASRAQDCEERGLVKHINWDNLMSQDPEISVPEIPSAYCDINFHGSTYELEVDCRLEYLGYATDNSLLKGQNGLGITLQITGKFHKFIIAVRIVSASHTKLEWAHFSQQTIDEAKLDRIIQMWACATQKVKIESE